MENNDQLPPQGEDSNLQVDSGIEMNPLGEGLAQPEKPGNSQKQKARGKKKKGCLGRLFRLLLGFVVLLALGGLINLMLNKRDPAGLMPGDFLFYLQVPSVQTVMDQWLELEAAEIVLAQPELAGLRQTLVEFRSQAWANHFLVKQLLDLRVDVMVLRGENLLLALDTGWRGLPLRVLPLVEGLLSGQPGLEIQKSGGDTFYYLDLASLGSTDGAAGGAAGGTSGGAGPDASEGGTAPAATESQALELGFTIQGNLILMTLQGRGLPALLEAARGGNSLADRFGPEELEPFRGGGAGALRFLINTQEIMEETLGQTPEGQVLVNSLNFPSHTLVSADIRNEEILLQARVPVASPNPVLEQVLARRPRPLAGLRGFPGDTYVFSALNWAPFRTLLELTATLQGEDFRGIVNQADSTARGFLGLGLDELLFDWAGEEAGFFQTSSSTEPIFFLSIANRRALEESLEILGSSLLLSGDRDLVVDGVRLGRLQLPGFLSGILGLFGVNLPTPYYLILNDLIYFSLDPEVLPRIQLDQRRNQLLIQSETFRNLMDGVSNDPALLFHYDLSRSIPFFLQGRGTAQDILRLYGEGLVSLHNRQDRLEFRLRARKVPQRGTAVLPGFPRPAGAPLRSPVQGLVLAGSPAPALVYATNSALVVSDLNGNQVFQAPVEEGTQWLPEIRGREVQSLYALSPQGNVYRISPRAEGLQPYPLVTEFRGAPAPVFLDGRVGIYSRTENALVFLDSQGRRTSWPPLAYGELNRPPVQRDAYWVYATRGFEAEVSVTNNQGRVLAGWPQDGGGLSLGSPVLLRWGRDWQVAFLTQAGVLSLWSLEGQLQSGFPLALDGTYQASPVAVATGGNEELIAVLSAEPRQAVLSLVGRGGRVLRQAAMPVDGREARILARDINGDGVDELFLYGDGDWIRAYDQLLQPLEGFPVQGHWKPDFQDMNRDGVLDMVTGTLGNNLVVYSILGP